MSKSKRPVGRPKTSDLVTFSVKIPRKLQAQLDRAAGNSYDSRNMVIRRWLWLWRKRSRITGHTRTGTAGNCCNNIGGGL